MKRLHKSMNGIIGVLLMALMLVPNGLKAETTDMLQTSKITGIVTDDSGEPVIGVTVRVKNACSKIHRYRVRTHPNLYYGRHPASCPAD